MLTHTLHRPESWKYEPTTLGGRRIVVTGGTTGIGRSTALLLACLGAKVLIFGRETEHLNQAREAMSEYEDRVVGLTADVSNEADVDRVFQTADEELGGVDALVNNAGVGGSSVTQEGPEDYRYAIETNLLGYMACARRAVPRLKANGGGAIINVGSLSARERTAGSDVYTAAKSGLRGFSVTLGKQVQSEGIRVTLIEPGEVGADLHPTSPGEEWEMAEQEQMLFSECIAEAVAFCLCQPGYCMIPMLQVQPRKQTVGG